MAKNLGREYATMSEDQRRQFAMEEESGDRETPSSLEFEEPRNDGHRGEHFANLKQEVADPEHRDGLSAELDDEQHARAVRAQATRAKGVEDGERIRSRLDDV
jgi:hypothetical protein